MSGAIPTDVYQSKAYKRAEKLLGRERAKEMMSRADGDLKSMIGQCISEMGAREVEMKENIDFRKAQDVIKTLRGGLRDTNKPEKATVELAKAIIQARNS